jgi:transposase
LLLEDSTIPAARIRELIAELGYEGGKTILDDYVREWRPVLSPPRTYQHTDYRPGEILQVDLWEPRHEIPVGGGETRRGYVVVAALAYSRVGAGALIFSKRPCDVLWGLSQCVWRLGGLAKLVVSDREGALHAGGGQPTDAYARWLLNLRCESHFCAPRDPEAKGVIERLIGYIETSFEPARSFEDPGDFQAQLDGWFDQRANVRRHQTLRRRPVDLLDEERDHLRELPEDQPDTDRRIVRQVPPQPYVCVDTNRYSLDPRFVARRVEVREGQREITAVALDSRELVASHARSFRRHQTITDPEHQARLDALREQRRDGGEVVEIRPLERYDKLVA